MKEADRKAKKYLEKKEKQLDAAKVRDEKRNASFIPPSEEKDVSRSKPTTPVTTDVDVEKLKKKVKKLQNKMQKKKSTA